MVQVIVLTTRAQFWCACFICLMFWFCYFNNWHPNFNHKTTSKQKLCLKKDWLTGGGGGGGGALRYYWCMNLKKKVWKWVFFFFFFFSFSLHCVKQGTCIIEVYNTIFQAGIRESPELVLFFIPAWGWNWGSLSLK